MTSDVREVSHGCYQDKPKLMNFIFKTVPRGSITSVSCNKGLRLALAHSLEPTLLYYLPA